MSSATVVHKNGNFFFIPMDPGSTCIFSAVGSGHFYVIWSLACKFPRERNETYHDILRSYSCTLRKLYFKLLQSVIILELQSSETLLPQVCLFVLSFPNMKDYSY